jgi:hypothetical protein
VKESIDATRGEFGPSVTLKLVGLWKDMHSIYPRSRWPHPAGLVDRGWEAGRREKIVAYLRQGDDLGCVQCGFSYCRFEGCEVSVFEMGNRDLTDGDWLWPEGLPHYVEAHGVRLPEAFVATMEANGFEVPPLGITYEDVRGDDSFWVEWSRENAQPFE